VTVIAEPRHPGAVRQRHGYVTSFSGDVMSPGTGHLNIYDNDFNQIDSIELDGVSVGLATGRPA
jgi:hypothetical protein